MSVVTADLTVQPANSWADRQGGLSVQVGGLMLGDNVAVTNAAGGTQYYCNVTFQVGDQAGNTISQVFELSIYLSDASTGAGLTATTASGGISVTTGTQMQAKVAAKALDVLTDATGKCVLQIIDSAKTGFYPCVEVPGSGIIIVGAQLTTASYHA